MTALPPFTGARSRLQIIRDRTLGLLDVLDSRAASGGPVDLGSVLLLFEGIARQLEDAARMLRPHGGPGDPDASPG